MSDFSPDDIKENLILAAEIADTSPEGLRGSGAVMLDAVARIENLEDFINIELASMNQGRGPETPQSTVGRDTP